MIKQEPLFKVTVKPALPNLKTLLTSSLPPDFDLAVARTQDFIPTEFVKPVVAAYGVSTSHPDYKKKLKRKEIWFAGMGKTNRGGMMHSELAHPPTKLEKKDHFSIFLQFFLSSC